MVQAKHSIRPEWASISPALHTILASSDEQEGAAGVTFYSIIDARA
jgi:hypothetical protein